METSRTLPSFFTEQENMIAASFCPCVIRPALSMWLINESELLPRRIGRYIGNLALCVEPTSTCGQARSTIDNKITELSPHTRMGRYAIHAQRHFNRDF